MAAGRTQQGAVAGRAPADARVAAMLARHGGALMRVARQWSLCHDDALDAFQRGLEIYVRRLDSVEPATEAAWLKVVIRHEAMAIRRARSDCVPDPDVDLEASLPSSGRSVEEQVLSGDRVSRSAEALRALKPDEARALMLKAHGMSYDEIARHCGWTYTKVNRAITEGRRRFMEVYAALEAGAECERFAPLLRALAAGRATSDELTEIRPHLRRCPACRATVRDLHRSKLRRLPLLVPVPALLGPLRWLRERFGPHAPEPDPTALHATDAAGEATLHIDTVAASAHAPHVPGLDGLPLDHIPGFDGTPLVDLPGRGASPLGGAPGLDSLPLHHVHGVDGTPLVDSPGLHDTPSIPDAVDLPQLPEAPTEPPLPDATVVERQIDRFERLRQQLTSLAHRTNSSDLAAAIHAFATAGGGRAATVGTIVGLCLSGVGAGTVCLVTGVIQSPFGLGSERHHAVPHVAHRHAPLPSHAGRALSAELTTARPAPTATPAPHPRRNHVVRTRHRSTHKPQPTPTPVPASVDPSQGTSPTSQENAPISPAPPQPAAQEEFAAAPSSGTGTQAPPAPAPATGGGEFAP